MEEGKEKYHMVMKSIINEEVFHMYTQYGLGMAFPELWGSEWDSLMCKETAKLQCMKPGWWHEENACPNGNPDKSGSAP